MDPLSPSTSTLAPAISHIAETAASLSTELPSQNAGAQSAENSKIESDVELVTWVLNAPDRLKSLVEAGQRREAAHQWSVIQKVLDRWKDARGTDDVRSACQKVIQDFLEE
jgi:vacuolar protein sorting-associated protein 51